MSNPDYRARCAELVDLLVRFGSTFNIPIESPIVTRALAELAQPAQVAPTEQDVAELAGDVEFIQLPQDESTRSSFLLEFTRQAIARWGSTPPQPVAPEPGYEKGYAQEHLARLMRDAIGTETNHNVYIVAAGRILDRPEFAHVARWGTPINNTKEEFK
jgi:hypothetical protein